MMPFDYALAKPQNYPLVSLDADDGGEDHFQDRYAPGMNVTLCGLPIAEGEFEYEAPGMPVCPGCYRVMVARVDAHFAALAEARA